MYDNNKPQIAWFFVVFSAISDLFTTYIGIEEYNLVESNPLADSLLGLTGFSGLIVLKIVIIIICIILSDKLTYGRWYYISPIILTTIWIFISIYNLYLISIA